MTRQLSCVLRHTFALLTMLTAASAQVRAQSAAGATEFGATAVQGTAVQRSVTLTLSSNGTLAAISLLPASTTDFTVLDSGTCKRGSVYTAADTCTVAVAFLPSASGSASARVVLRSTSGGTLATTPLHGIGTGAQVAFTPGLVDTIALDGFAHGAIAGLAADAAGDLFFLEKQTGRILRLDAAGGQPTVFATSGNASAIAAAPDGTLYVLGADGAVTRLDAFTGASTLLLAAQAAGSYPTRGVAVTSRGTLLLATADQLFQVASGTVQKLPGLSASFQSIQAIAIAPDDTLLVLDAGAARLYRIDPMTGESAIVAGTGERCTAACEDGVAATATRLGTLLGVAADAMGNIYTVERENGLRRIDVATATIHTVLPSSASGVQVAALRGGGMAMLSAAGEPLRYNPGAAALTFAQTPVGQTSSDDAKTVALSNLGNAPLVLVPPASGTNPSTGADFPLSGNQSCPQLASSSSAGQLLPGQSCAIAVRFTPTTAGNLASAVTVTSTSTQTRSTNRIALAGTAVAAATQQANVTVISLPTTLVYGQPLSLLASVYSSSGSGPTPTGTVGFTEGSTVIQAGAQLSNGVAIHTITLPVAGTHTYQASYSGDSTYAPSQGVAAMATVNKANSVFTTPNIPSFTLGQTILIGFTLSGQYSGTGISLPTGNTSFQFLDSNGTLLSTGTALRNDQVNSVGQTAQPGTPAHGGTYTLRLIYPGDDNFLPLQRDYTITVRALDQTINFAQLPSPVTYGTGPFTLSATATSGLPVTFSLLSGPGKIVNGQLVVTGTGTIVVAADQAGNTDYSPAPQVTQTVVSVRPVATVNWPTPAPIYAGTPLSATQLNATATDTAGAPVAGTFVYSPAGGTVLPVGNNTLTVTFMPADAEHYGTTPVKASVTLVVRDAVTPLIIFNGGTVQYGTPLGTTLAASATAGGVTVPGSFVFTTGGNAVTSATVLPVGNYAVTATFIPADTTAFHSGAATATVTVVRSATSLSLVSSASPVLVQTSITLTARVAAGSVRPTGTVQFQTGSSILGTVPLAADGSAALPVTGLPAGAQTITALYSGDASYNAASATITQVIVDFTLTLASSSKAEMVVLPGKSATWTLNVAPSGASTLVSDVTLSITGLPTGATAKFSPATVAAGSASTPVTLTVTAPTTLKAALEPHPLRNAAVSVVAALLVLPFARRMRRSGRRLRGSVLGLILFAIFVTLSATGCGSGTGYFDQSQLSFPLTVTATSGSVSHTAAVRLTVQ